MNSATHRQIERVVLRSVLFRRAGSPPPRQPRMADATGKAGVRSLKALNFLRQQGFKYLKSVKGREKRRGRLAALRRITA